MKKKGIKRNQIILGVLAVLLGVAGYINFSGNDIDLAPGEKVDQTKAAFAEDENMLTPTDAGETLAQELENEEYIELNSDEEHIGEAVMASTGVAGVNFVNIKLNREQTRSLNKENLLEIINGDGMDEAAVQSATDAYVKLSEQAEMEQEIEAVLSAKGYGEVIASVGEDSVDVVLNCSQLTDVQRAQVEDVVVRKTGCDITDLVITLTQ